MKRNFKFFRIFSMWILLTFVSAKDHPKCEEDRPLRYNLHDFDEWGKISPICEKGKMQSPIDLGTKVEVYKHKDLPVKSWNCNHKIRGIMENDGHSVVLKAYGLKNKPTITGSLLDGEKYEFYGISLHWGRSDDNGTEHSIVGKKYAAELHMLRKNVKYPNIWKALGQKDGVTITALLFEHNKDKPPNKGLQKLAKLACAVSDVGSVIKTDFDLSSLDLLSVKSFFTYNGSLTEPPCTENVRWFIPTKPMSIDEESLTLLRSVNLYDNDKSNIRPTQESGDRKVEVYAAMGY